MVYNATDAPDLTNVTSLANMFNMEEYWDQGIDGATFYGDFSNWETGNVTDMNGTFLGANSFNGDISGWDVSQVTDMKNMFVGATSFNADISGWDTGSVTNMDGMFGYTTEFNADIGGWDVSHVTDMYGMFYEATSFSRNLGQWDISNVTDMDLMLDFSGMSPVHYGATLQLWAAQANVPSNLTLGADGLQIDCDDQAMIDARDFLINDKNWNIWGDTPCP